ncbi:MAG: hypothetical protein DRO95_00835 [Candidatus Altiarchaeales archaeon]|nr:MAG: hypothetical protein DRO95_00835 [Candidatus Altiarchaeales archaeon]
MEKPTPKPPEMEKPTPRPPEMEKPTPKPPEMEKPTPRPPKMEKPTPKPEQVPSKPFEIEKPAEEVEEKKPIKMLRELVQKEKKIEASRAAEELGMSEDEVMRLARELKEEGIIEIKPKFLGGAYLQLTPDALKKIKAIEEREKAEIIKRELERLRREKKFI